MRGRKPKSPKLRVLMGEPSLTRVNYAEPIPATNIGEPPAWMTDAQRAKWLHDKAHSPAGLVKEIDATAFNVCVVLGEEFADLSREYAKVRSRLSKKAIALRAERRKCAAALRSYLTDLGQTPAARPRLQATPEPDGKSEFEKLIG